MGDENDEDGGPLRGPTVFYCNASILFQKQIVGHVTRINQSGNFAQISRGGGGQKSFNRTDLKCLFCKKVVSSRQFVLKHGGIYHQSENISGNITKIQTNDLFVCLWKFYMRNCMIYVFT